MDVSALRSLVIDGPTVRIRGLAERDLPFTLAWRNDDRSLRWFKSVQPLESSSHVTWYRRYVADSTAGCMFFVEEHDGRPVGQSSIYHVDGSRAEVGRFLSSPELRGKGLFREALLLTLGAAFDIAGLDQVYLEVIATNDRAIRLYESVGFEQDDKRDGLVTMQLDRKRFRALDIAVSTHVTKAGSN